MENKTDIKIGLNSFEDVGASLEILVHSNHLCLRYGDMIISLSSQDSTKETESCDSSTPSKIYQSYGILGKLNIKEQNYLVSVSDAELVGETYGFGIYRAKSIVVLPLDEFQVGERDEWALLAEQGFSYTSPIFFSKFPIHLKLGEEWVNYMNGEESSLNPLFMWNSQLFANALGWPKEIHKFLLISISGHISYTTIDKLSYLLISRRSNLRSGTRFTRRGLDSAGNCANFVETEQLLLSKTGARSILIIRGSVPVMWRQTPTLKYTPVITIKNDKKPSKIHFDTLKRRYGDVTYISLLNDKGIEKPLTDQYNSVAKENDVDLRTFDFHKECSNMRYENLNKLVDSSSDKSDSFGYSEVVLDGEKGKWEIAKSQKGVFRINCLDSLDRCNVTQSALSGPIFSKMEDDFGNAVISPEKKKTLVNFQRNAWANNADDLSVGYSGTGAQKTDYTRTGKRTYEGKVRDLFISGMRYVKNNFSDGTNQDAMDLSLGKVISKANQNYPSRFNMRLLLPLVFLPTVLSQMALVFGKKTVVLVSAGILYLAVKYFGRSFVNTAKLLRDETEPFESDKKDKEE